MLVTTSPTSSSHPTSQLPRRIHRSNHAHAVASLVNHVANVVSSAFSVVYADYTVSVSTYKQLTIASMIRACTIYFLRINMHEQSTFFLDARRRVWKEGAV